MKPLVAFALSSAFLLTACGDDPESGDQADTAAAAEGDVLGGMISDEMLPLGELRSQSPPLREAARDSATSDQSARPSSEAAASASSGGADEEPAARPEASESEPAAED